MSTPAPGTAGGASADAAGGRTGTGGVGGVGDVAGTPGTAGAAASRRRRVRVHHLQEAKAAGRRLAMLTAYDAVTARIFDEAGVDLLLVGDSIGNTMHGQATTLPVTLDEMVVAARSVVRGARYALVVADLPFGTYEAGPEQALASGVRMLKESGAAAVKIEGGRRIVPQVRALSDAGIPVVGHLGYTPQSEHRLGGPRVQGRGDEAADRLTTDAVALQEAGAVAVVLEMVPAPVAERVTEVLAVPTIGIGAGAGCDGQVLVWVDMAGMGEWSPRFARRFGEVGAALTAAASGYAAAVRDGSFPAAEHTFDA
ncbi:3-methyl-2-oxobutanoate hydroxymethyltransferase [Cellulomonas endophytica]|uniref:3-methyl-2-oxobutanoate hydroxymethyltransferase n=1 Tax=Cellulomonas endophytica TaxID=2494735 RepID=UPI0010111287|nr:3-methyl-2-oxobutanoate hydroxymethyltransferase [Cellulomonas endophytica]